MAQTLLSFEQSPPFSVPAPYFAAAPLFAAAAGLLLFLDPSLFQSRWLPGTLALTHLLTLGFFAMVMLGAFQQLLPVLAGAEVPRATLLAPAVCAALAAGTLLLAAGFLTGAAHLFTWALLLLGAAFTPFLLLAAWSLYRAPSNHPTVHAMAAALGALAVTVGVGLLLAAGHAGLALLQRQFTADHVAWGAVGWIALLVAGVAWQVVPMFQLTPDYPRWLVRLWVRGLVGALLLYTVAGGRWPLGAALPASLPLIAFAVVTLDLQRRRRRRLPDVTVAFWQTGMVSLLGALALWPGAALAGWEVSPLLVGTLFLVGFGQSVITGMLYKIVPFLIWLHLNNLKFAADASFEVPTMKQVIPEAQARRQLRAHLLGLCLLILAALFPSEAVTRLAAMGFLLSAAWLAYNIGSAIALYERRRRGARHA